MAAMGGATRHEAKSGVQGKTMYLLQTHVTVYIPLGRLFRYIHEFSAMYSRTPVGARLILQVWVQIAYSNKQAYLVIHQECHGIEHLQHSLSVITINRHYENIHKNQYDVM